jgi:hypothetical protein
MVSGHFILNFKTKSSGINSRAFIKQFRFLEAGEQIASD